MTSEAHISKQFDAELDQARALALSMGGLVERQVVYAIEALRRGDRALTKRVIQIEVEVNALERKVDRRFQAILRELLTYMIEDPRTISTSIDVLFVAKALERIGDHTKNITEYVIYLIRGKDVRHLTPERFDEVVAS